MDIFLLVDGDADFDTRAFYSIAAAKRAAEEMRGAPIVWELDDENGAISVEEYEDQRIWEISRVKVED